MSAETDAAVKYGAQEEAIKRRIASNQAATAANVAGMEQYRDKGTGAVNSAYDILDSNLTANKADTAQQLSGQANSVSQGWQAVNQVGEAARNKARTDVSQLAAKLGLAGAELPVASEIESTALQLSDRAREGDATYTGNLKNWSGQIESLLGRGQANGKTQRADAQQRLQAEALKAIADLQLQGQREDTELAGQYNSLMGEKGLYQLSRADELAAQEWDRQFRQAQLDQQAQQSNAELSLRAAGMNADNAYRSRSQDTSKEDFWKLLEYDLKRQGMGADNQDRNTSNERFDAQMELDWAKLAQAGQTGQRGEDPMALASILLGANGGVYDADTAMNVLRSVGLLPEMSAPSATQTPQATSSPNSTSATSAPTLRDLDEELARKKMATAAARKVAVTPGTENIPRSVNMGGLRFG